VNVRDFGAVGDGVTDDTAALLAAIAVPVAARGGVVYAPQGKYRFNQTLVLGDPLAFTSVQLRGDGPFNTLFQWTGAADGTALRFERCKYMDSGGFMVQNTRNGVLATDAAAGAARGASTGLWLTGGGLGTQTNSGNLRNIAVQGFDKGLRLGEDLAPNFPSASEMTITNPILTYCNYGAHIQNPNSTDIWFYGLEASVNQYGLYASNAEPIHVWGGAMTSNTVADIHLTSGGAFTVEGVRSEHSPRFFENAGNTAPKCVRLATCVLEAPQDATAALIALGPGSLAVVQSCYIQGRVQANGQFPGSVQLQNCAIADTEPFRLDPNGGNQHGQLRYLVTGCWQLAADGRLTRPLPDRCGKIGQGTNGYDDLWRG
jgi:hypothetical protein